MSDLINAVKDALANSLLRGSAYPAATTAYVALYIADGTTECTGGSYARQAVGFTAFSGGGVSSNAAQVTFPTATASWGATAITYFRIYDAASGGNALSNIKALTAPLGAAVVSGDIVKFAPGALTFVF